jgi:hypothetical protein
MPRYKITIVIPPLQGLSNDVWVEGVYGSSSSAMSAELWSGRTGRIQFWQYIVV